MVAKQRADSSELRSFGLTNALGDMYLKLKGHLVFEVLPSITFVQVVQSCDTSNLLVLDVGETTS